MGTCSLLDAGETAKRNWRAYVLVASKGRADLKEGGFLRSLGARYLAGVLRVSSSLGVLEVPEGCAVSRYGGVSPEDRTLRYGGIVIGGDEVFERGD